MVINEWPRNQTNRKMTMRRESKAHRNDWNATDDKKVKKKMNLRENRKVTERFSQEECKRNASF